MGGRMGRRIALSLMEAVMRRIRPALLILALFPALQGCVVIGATAMAADVAVGVAGDVVEGGVNATGAAIDIVTPDGDDDEDDG